MAALELRMFSKASDQTLADFKALISVALFSFAGLLASVSFIVLDQYFPGEWLRSGLRRAVVMLTLLTVR